VLNAFQGNANSSGTSTKAALDALDEYRDSGPVDSASAAPPAPAATEPPDRPSEEALPLPRPPTIPPPIAEATPAVVAREASSSTSPGSASFAEGPSSVGRDDDLDDDERAAIAPARAIGIVAFLRTTRGLAIVGGGAVLVIILLVVALSGGKHDAKKAPVASKKSDKTTVATADTNGSGTRTEDTNTGEAGPQQVVKSGGETGESGSESGSGESGETNEAGSGSATTEGSTEGATAGSAAKTGGAKAPKSGGGKTLGGKQVVLEYDTQARTAESVPNNASKSDQGAISKARQSYAAGNTRLFAGDADGAIRYYKQALGYYPAYVAGYRGLGLAYAQQGNKPAAVQAFRTYVSSVPGAKDAPLIRKRITTLQAK